jgi:hypothetical protein
MTTEPTPELGTFSFQKPIRCLTYPKGPNLFEAHAFERNGKAVGAAKFGADLLIPNDHPELKAIKDKAISVAKAQWPGVAMSDLFPLKEGSTTERVGWPFKSGDDKAAKRIADGKKGDLTQGMTILKARSLYEPKLGGLDNGQPVDYDGEASKAKAKAKFYSGVEVLAGVNFVAVEVDGKKYVTCYLNMVFTLNKGERVGGGKSAAETFKGYVGQVNNENPAAGMDSEENF